MKPKKYDIIILGAGVAGLNIASFLNGLKLKVLLVEKHLVGGDCLNFGCVPSKALLAVAHTVAAARKAEAFGLHPVGEIEMARVTRKVKERREVIRVHENPDYFRQKGIDVKLGAPRFTSPDTIELEGETYRAKRIVIATGSRAAIPPIPGLDNVEYFTNETIFENKKLPQSLLIIGAGPIGLEMAQAYRRLGSEVTVVDIAPRILPREDPEISQLLLNVLEAEGIRSHLGAVPLEFPDKHRLRLKTADGGKEGAEQILSFDALLVAAGRRLNTGGLDLEKAGIETDGDKLVLTPHLRTTNKRVICCGDAAGGFQFTHWAEYQVAVAINNMLSPFKKKVNASLVAWVTYTDPEIATFGLNAEELEASGKSFETVKLPLAETDRAICEDIHEGMLKLFLRKGKIVGGTLAAPGAGEMVGELISFMTLGIPFKKMYRRIHPYPTMARIHRVAVQQYLGKKLTPAARRLLRWLYKIF